MSERVLGTPVVLMVFNRPALTQRVFDAIREVRPSMLLAIGDGPRQHEPEDLQKCNAVRRIIETVDWPCEVRVDYSDVNLGCRRRIASGLDWVFRNVDEAIILEDDCLPDATFFRFCSELLERYRHDERVMAISGTSLWPGEGRSHYSYRFSTYTEIWGWASWSRAWRYYDADMRLWPSVKDDKVLEGMFKRRALANYWTGVFQECYEGLIDTWDYQWFFANLVQRGLCIVPNGNLVSNIGLGGDGTHLRDLSRYRIPELQPMSWPLVHPGYCVAHAVADRYYEKNFFLNKASLLSRGYAKVGRGLGLLRALVARRPET